jgi:hypothetical protein
MEDTPSLVNIILRPVSNLYYNLNLVTPGRRFIYTWFMFQVLCGYIQPSFLYKNGDYDYDSKIPFWVWPILAGAFAAFVLPSP